MQATPNEGTVAIGQTPDELLVPLRAYIAQARRGVIDDDAGTEAGITGDPGTGTGPSGPDEPGAAHAGVEARGAGDPDAVADMSAFALGRKEIFEEPRDKLIDAAIGKMARCLRDHFNTDGDVLIKVRKIWPGNVELSRKPW